MRTHFVICLLALAFANSPPGTARPFLIGERASELEPSDLAKILSLTARYGSAWLLDINEAEWLRPPNLRVGVYLAPDVVSSTVRRGRLLGVVQEPSPAPPGYEWHVRGDAQAWAQVALPGEEFGTRMKRPRTLDRPFLVLGNPSDNNLASLVAFIRDGPEKPERTTHNPDGSLSFEIAVKVDGKNPILVIEKKAEAIFRVSTERRHGTGQAVEVRKGDKGWQVVSVGVWSG